jgi:hypothetical protein
MPEAVEATTPTEVVEPGSTRDLYEEVLADRLVSDRDTAKEVIAQRVREVDRLRALLAKAEGALAELLQKDVSEIANLADSRKCQTFLTPATLTSWRH